MSRGETIFARINDNAVSIRCVNPPDTKPLLVALAFSRLLFCRLLIKRLSELQRRNVCLCLEKFAERL
jgi:23S rRNA C2498 (ribose-2'-O)-methylase RlmM